MVKALSTVAYSCLAHNSKSIASATTDEPDNNWFALQKQLAVLFDESYKRGEPH